MERFRQLHAHVQGVHRRPVQQPFQCLHEMLAEIMILVQPHPQFRPGQARVLEGAKEWVGVDRMIGELGNQGLEELVFRVHPVSHRRPA